LGGNWGRKQHLLLHVYFRRLALLVLIFVVGNEAGFHKVNHENLKINNSIIIVGKIGYHKTVQFNWSHDFGFIVYVYI